MNRLSLLTSVDRLLAEFAAIRGRIPHAPKERLRGLPKPGHIARTALCLDLRCFLPVVSQEFAAQLVRIGSPK